MAAIIVKVEGTVIVTETNDLVEIDIPGGGEATIESSALNPANKLRIRYKNDNEADTVNVDLSTFATENLQIDIFQYDPTDTLNLIGAYNTWVDPDDPGVFHFEYIGSDGETYSAYVNAMDGGEKDFTTPLPPIIICFGRGTLILTDRGERPVEDLVPGDLIVTLDNGLQELRWVGQRDLGAADLAAVPALRPIRVRRDAFAPGSPHRDMVLSPNHCVMLGGWRAEMLFGQEEVLVPVKALVNDTTITVDRAATEIGYYHLLFDRHEIIFADGVPSESLFLGAQAQQAITPEGLSEIEALFGGELLASDAGGHAARSVLRMREASLLAAA